MSKEIITSYSEIRDSLQTFDILNCIYGTDPFNPIHWIMGAIGHTAMVYRCNETGQIMVYESTQTSRKDGLTGVQLRPMGEWVDKYPGRIYVRQVTFKDGDNPLRFGDTKIAKRLHAEKLCTEHIRKYRGTAYPDLSKWKWRWFLANAAIDLPGNSKLKRALENPDIDFVMFCAHLIGHVFRYCEMIEKGCNVAELEPDDFRISMYALIAITLWLYNYIEIGDEIRMK